MKITKFRIKNFKSIVDSGDCYLENDLTIFAGKNESGKTSILEALEAFNITRQIPPNAFPLKKNNQATEIILNIVFTKDEVNKYYEVCKIEKRIETEIKSEIIKTLSGYKYDEISRNVFEIPDNLEISELQKKTKAAYDEVGKYHDTFLKKYKIAFFPYALTNLQDTIQKALAYNNNFVNSYVSSVTASSQPIFQRKLKNLIDLLIQYQTLIDTNSRKWDAFSKLLPNFILFRSFEDIIPNEIPFAELEKNEFIKDLIVISDIDIPLIKSDDRRNKFQHQKHINIQINNDYSKFWLQDLTEIVINWDNGILMFWIEENDTTYQPSERSKGKQWHMSFYIKITARTVEEKTNVILIDEPGLYLHATAQNDIYKKLIDCSKKSQVLFTTHSPYLINRDELHRVRLVLKNLTSKDEGTFIENKLHSRADKETLTPILTAIGLGLNDGIQNIKQLNNIVVEGPADYFYLQGLKIILKNESFNLIFGGGSGNMGNVGSILSGWGGKVVYLFDNDQGMRDGGKNLVKVWHVKKELILSILEQEGSIEDIFSTKDFLKYVLWKDAKIEGSNSDYVKKNISDKVLLAKQFNALCHNEEVALSKETMENAKKLFEKLNSTFKDFDNSKLNIKKAETSKPGWSQMLS